METGEEISQSEESHEIPEDAPPLLVLMGAPLTYKTAVGDLIGQQGTYTFYDVDRVREVVIGDHNNKRGTNEEEKAKMKKSYEEMFKLAREDLLQGKRVIIASTMATVEAQTSIMQLAEAAGVEYQALLLMASEQAMSDRLSMRIKEGSDSNVRELKIALEKAAQIEQSLLDLKKLDKELNVARIETTGISPEAVVGKISAVLQVGI